MPKEYLKKFYEKNRVERIEELVLNKCISKEDAVLLKDRLQLPAEVADHMIENQIATYELPLGVALNFFIDQKEYVVPMAIEEPSVIAAASSAAKIINQAGGFQTTIQNRRMIGQVALKDIPDLTYAQETVMKHQLAILQKANEAHPSIVKRGGGAKEIVIRPIAADQALETPSFLVIHLHIETLEAMGANIIDTMVEAINGYSFQLRNRVPGHCKLPNSDFFIEKR
jgi:hydroxymethylglutaryl-CoA reductase